jgi:hypothetical protein
MSTSLRGINGNGLKVIAMVTMFIDHLGMIFFPEVALLRIIGRASFPLYAYLIAEGCRYTKHRLRYFLQVFILGIVCSIVFAIAERYVYLCVLVTFSLSMLLIFLIDYVREAFNSRCVLLVIALVVVGILCKYVEVDYGFMGVLVPVMAYIPKEKQYKLITFAISLLMLSFVMGGIQYYSLISVLLVMFYNGERGKLNLKWFFYGFYPVHLAVLWGISMLIY